AGTLCREPLRHGPHLRRLLRDVYIPLRRLLPGPPVHRLAETDLGPLASRVHDARRARTAAVDDPGGGHSPSASVAHAVGLSRGPLAWRRSDTWHQWQGGVADTPDVDGTPSAPRLRPV